MRALVVDPDATTRGMLADALRPHGFEVAGCADAESACRATDTGTISLVLVAERLPDQCGLELCRQLQTGSDPRRLVVVLTTADTPARVQRIVAAGADDYLVLPRDLPVLEARVALLAQQAARAARAARAQEVFDLWSTSAPVGVFMIQPNELFVFANRQLQSDTGYSEDDLRGMRSTDLVHPDDIEEVRNQTRATLQRTRSTPFEFRYITKAGTVRWGVLTVIYITYRGSDAVMGQFLDITERKHAEQALIISKERYRRLVELSPEAIAVHCEGRIAYINPAGVALLGATEPGELIGQPITDFIHPAFHDLVQARVHQTQHEGREAPLAAEQLVRLDGQVVDVEVVAIPTTHSGKPATQVIARDITERKRAEVALRRSEERYRDLVDNANDGIYTHDLTGHITSTNRALERVTGYSREGIRALRVKDLVAPEYLDQIRQLTPRLLAGEAIPRFELEIITKHGSRVPLEVSIRLLHEDGRPVEVQGIARDIGERKTLEAQLTHQAFHDSLTGLPNRALFQDHLTDALAQRSGDGAPVALLFIDLDNFKMVNDGLGHQAGDDLLVAVAKRLAGALRPGDTVARFGGDEFAVLLEGTTTPSAALRVADRIQEALRVPVRLAGREVIVTASIGIVLGAPSHTSPAEFLRQADVALYQAKGAGKAQASIFDEGMTARARAARPGGRPAAGPRLG